jgi:hypothetical protein
MKKYLRVFLKKSLKSKQDNNFLTLLYLSVKCCNLRKVVLGSPFLNQKN